MNYLVMAAILVLAGCARQAPDTNSNVGAIDSAAPLSPGISPVRIGEGGAGFPACATRGTVTNLSPGGVSFLPLRAAPFVEAAEIARLDNGTPLFLCARSIDQKWQGVVVPLPDRPDADCGVAAPIDAPRDYRGPCRAGWVASDFVRIGAAIPPAGSAAPVGIPRVSLP